MERSSKHDSLRNPFDSAGVISKLFFWWLTPFFFKGYKKDLDANDLYSVPKLDHAEYLGDLLEKEWQKELDNLLQNKHAYLSRAIIRCFGLHFTLMGVFCFIEECGLHVAQPIFLGTLIQYFRKNSEMSQMEAFMYATGVILTAFIFPLTHHPYFFGVIHVGMKIRVACCNLVYRKALRLSQSALGQTTIGQMVNLLSNDVGRFDQSVIFLHYLWVGPLQVLIIVWILWSNLHVACLVGVSILLLLIPVQSYMGRIFGKFRLKTAKITDQRIHIMNEVISGIRVIKMYAWEKPFASLVDEVRRLEVKILTKTSFVRALNMAIFSVSSKFILLLTFLTMILQGDPLTAENVFMTVALYNNIRLVMTLFFPFGISQGAETIVSIKRLQKFLLLEEKRTCSAVENINLRNENINLSNVKSENLNGLLLEPNRPRIIVENISASWDENGVSLKDISFAVYSEELLAVVGPVGSGKTSLLMALLGELPIHEGHISIYGKIAFVCQEPWIFQSTIRRNIIFGSEYDEKRYREVIRACALDKDFREFPYGDLTEIGDKGTSLSGGQKARVNLARALYIDADVYLLDDPLSAVDAAIGQHLFDKCIRKFLHNKVCILVTHQVQYLKAADEIIVIKDGACLASGNYHQLSNMNLDFITFHEEGSMSDLRASELSLHKLDAKSLSLSSLKALSLLEANNLAITYSKGDEQQMKEEESRVHGEIGIGLYWQYFRAGASYFYLFLLFVITIITHILFCGSEYWLTLWTNSEERKFESSAANVSDNSSVIIEDEGDLNLYVYSGLVASLFVLSLLRCAMFFYLCLRSSVHLHNRMFQAIIHVPMKFFEKNPIGRILNRFSKDIGIIDELVPPTLDDCIDIGFRVIGIIVLVALVNYWIIIPSLCLAVLFHALRKFYLHTARDVKRLEGISRSPVFSHLSSSLYGLTSIRAMKIEHLLRKEFEFHQDQHSASWFLFISTARWLGIWLDWLCNIYITVVTYSLLFGSGNLMGGDVGLAITSALLLSGMCQWGVRQSAEAENLMISCERIIEYSKLEPDAALTAPLEKKPPLNWPSYGIITFEAVSVSYSPTDPPILKNLYFCIRASEKVGIVGRTGAGKSSLLSSLFRLVDFEGNIRIDGIDIKEIGLHDIRKKISVIPQDPIIFMGTMRYNLDPFSDHSDEELWRALEDVQLKELFMELPGGLDTELHEGGTNLSVGQRQLVCLARAILRKNKILVLDEATANVDQTTDVFIQKTIREKFVSCTVLTVAHRLNTIMDSDRVMVLDTGKIVEFDEPYTLLKDKNSHFYNLVEMTGRANAKQLKATAYRAYLARTSDAVHESPETTDDDDNDKCEGEDSHL